MEFISYEKFCVNVQDAVKRHYKKEDVVQLHTVRKLNGVILKGISITTKNGNIMPTLYLDKYYMEYEEGTPFDEIVQMFLDEYERAGIKDNFDIRFFSEYEKVKIHLGFKLMHYEMNREFLEDIPHQRFLDLALVCFCDIRDRRIGHGSITIKTEHLEMWKITEEELFLDATRNMEKLYPADFMNMAEVLKELYKDPAGLLDVTFPMYVLTNKERVNGAASLLYKGKMEEIAKFMNGDYYVLPSSIHEVILMPKKENGTDEENLSRMVAEINREHLAREEVLANHAYLYQSDTGKLVALPLVPYKKNCR